MLTKDLVIRCYAKKEGDLWVAVCIDLCLAAQDDTLEGARRKMELQIIDYIEEAYSEIKYAPQLLRRKAPIRQQVIYHFARALHGAHACKDAVVRILDVCVPMAPAKAVCKAA